MAALTDDIRAAGYYESTWHVFRIGLFKVLDDEQAAIALAAWGRSERIDISFEVRRVREHEVLFVVLRPKDHYAR